MSEVELKKKWIAALRSGDYKQGRGWLIQPWSNRCCCMGVLAHVMGKEKEVRACRTFSDSAIAPPGFLSGYVRGGGVHGGHGVVSSLVHMNDTDMLTFPQIADWVEENIDVR